MAKQIDFDSITLRIEVSSRGGGIEIDLTSLGFKGEKMTAYQNYLGGGLLGRVCSSNTINAFNKKIAEKKQVKLDAITDDLKRYFHSLTNPEDSEWEGMDFDKNQKMPVSAY